MGGGECEDPGGEVTVEVCGTGVACGAVECDVAGEGGDAQHQGDLQEHQVDAGEAGELPDGGEGSAGGEEGGGGLG